MNNDNKHKRKMRAANRIQRNLNQAGTSNEPANGKPPAKPNARPNADDDVELSFKVDPLTMLRIVEEGP